MYFKRTDETTTFYYNTESKTVIEESDGQYLVHPYNPEAPGPSMDEIDQEEFEDKADDVSTYARLGTHPPLPPGH